MKLRAAFVKENGNTIFYSFHSYAPLCLGLSHDISIKHIEVCVCNVAKCKNKKILIFLID